METNYPRTKWKTDRIHFQNYLEKNNNQALFSRELPDCFLEFDSFFYCYSLINFERLILLEHEKKLLHIFNESINFITISD